MTSIASRRSRKLLILLGIVLIAAFLRFYKIDTIPPGDRYDPAYYGVDALGILGGERPVFLPTNFGREALFSYLVALSVLILGLVPYAMYATSAVVGVLTVPAVYLVGEELFRKEEGTLREWGGLLSALVVAISYWHLNWSRFGVRAILLPFFAALTIYFLWRGLRGGSWIRSAVAGLCLGLSLHTYQAARILPLLVLVGLGCFLIESRASVGRALANLAIVGLVALVVFAPLGAYFFTHPGSFLQRIEQASVLGPSGDPLGSLQALGKGLVDTALAFSFRGDLEPTTSIPGRPSLNPFLSVLFFAGVLVSLFRFRRPAYLFLLSWLAIMTIPALLSQQGPIAKRAIGALPAIAMLIAMGTLVLWGMLHRWTERRHSALAQVAGVVLRVAIAGGFVWTAVVTYQDYFVVWAGDPDMFIHFEVGPTAIGRYVAGLPDGDAVYVSPLAADHPSIVYNAQKRSGVKSFDGRACIVAPEVADQTLHYLVVTGGDGHSLDGLRAVFPEGEVVAEGPLHFGEPYFVDFEVGVGSHASVAPPQSAEATWGNAIRLVGYELPAGAYAPGDVVKVTLYLQALGSMDRDYTVFIHLVGPYNAATQGPLWGQSDSEPCQRAYPTSVWAPGEITVDQYRIQIPPDAPPGPYQLLSGVYLLETLARLPANDSQGRPLADDAVPLGTLNVRGANDEP